MLREGKGNANRSSKNPLPASPIRKNTNGGGLGGGYNFAQRIQPSARETMAEKKKHWETPQILSDLPLRESDTAHFHFDEFAAPLG